MTDRSTGRPWWEYDLLDAEFQDRYGYLLSRLADHEFVQLAGFAAHELDLLGFAFVRLSPGDSTAYQMSVIRPPTNDQWQRWSRRHSLPPDHELHMERPEFNNNDHYYVAHSLGGGRLYPWQGIHVHPDYVYEKWTNRNGTTDTWTAYIIARFLTELADQIKERGDPA